MSLMIDRFCEKHVDAEAYLEASLTFAMEVFCENNSQLLAFNYFRKNPQS